MYSADLLQCSTFLDSFIALNLSKPSVSLHVFSHVCIISIVLIPSQVCIYIGLGSFCMKIWCFWSHQPNIYYNYT